VSKAGSAPGLNQGLCLIGNIQNLHILLSVKSCESWNPPSRWKKTGSVPGRNQSLMETGRPHSSRMSEAVYVVFKLTSFGIDKNIHH
jgi:hypothetical protein